MRISARPIATVATVILFLGVAAPEPKLTERQRALHALNRLAFGARPGDVDRVLRIGVDRWVDQQLHPERISDRELDTKLQQYPTLAMSSRDIWDRYYAPVVEARKEAKQDAASGNGNAKVDAKELRAKIPRDDRPKRVMDELTSQRILRASDSERQLNEVMADFWLNHFNVFSGKGIDRVLLTGYERDTIRPRMWGRFEDLLMATAKSPAMLFYLDNARSVADPDHRPGPPPSRMRTLSAARVPRQRMTLSQFAAARRDPTRRDPAAAKGSKGGLNENYAREIMELHTLGVDGGYTQNDVTELARIFTGWSIAKPEEGGGFVFREKLHDVGAKTVLGIYFPPGGGEEEGERMIRMLAHNPATAHHIAYKLCERLVADEPPPALVDRVAKRFLDTGGDLRLTVAAVIDSPEFWSPHYYKTKVKSPFAYVISAVRAVNADVADPIPIAKSLQQIGEPLYGAQPPTGYSEKAAVWINSGALLNRLNFALALAANKMPGVHDDVASFLAADAASDPDRSVTALALALTGDTLTPATRATITQRITETQKAPKQDPRDNTQLPLVAGLILGSPEFQKQ